MTAEENPVAWLYEIRDSNNGVAGTERLATHFAAVAAGGNKAREK